MDFIVDIQGFKKPIDEFVLKEISILEVRENIAADPITLLVKPPCQWVDLPAKYKCMNSWLQRNFHGMSWESGEMSYEGAISFIRAILTLGTTVFVKGLEKKRWLDRILIGTSVSVVDLETLACPSLRKLTATIPAIRCSHHPNILLKYNCSDGNVKALKSWLIQIRRNVDGKGFVSK